MMRWQWANLSKRSSLWVSMASITTCTPICRVSLTTPAQSPSTRKRCSSLTISIAQSRSAARTFCATTIKLFSPISKKRRVLEASLLKPNLIRLSSNRLWPMQRQLDRMLMKLKLHWKACKPSWTFKNNVRKKSRKKAIWPLECTSALVSSAV